MITNGTTTWSNTANNVGRFRSGGASTISNQGTWQDQNAFNNNMSNDFGGQGSTFINDGSYVKSGAGEVTFSAGAGGVAFDNNGSVAVNNGLLELNGGGNSTGGTYTVASGATLQLGGSQEIDASSSISGANVILGGANGISNIAASYDVSDSTSVTQGTHNLDGPIADLGSALSVSGGTLTVNGAVTTFSDSVTISNGTLDLVSVTDSTSGYEQTGGTLDGTGTLTVTGASSTWTGGGMTGTGTTQFDGDLTVGESGVQDFRGGRTVITNGTTTWSNTGNNVGRFRSGGASTISNQGTWQDQNAFNNNMSNDFGGQGSTFINDGSYVKSGAGEVTFSAGAGGVAFDNNGSVAVNNGLLELNGGGNSTGGTYTVASGATLQLGGSQEIDASSSISGANVILGGANGISNIAASYDVSDSTSVTQGTHNLDGPIADLGSALSVSGGTLTVNGPVTTFSDSVTISNGTLDLVSVTDSTSGYEQTGGTLDGTGTLTVTGASSTWTGGGMTGTGTTQFDGDLTVGESGVQDFRGGRTVITNGTTTWSNTGNNVGRFRSGGASTISNQGTWQDQNAFNNNMSNDFGGQGSTFINDGSYVKSGAGEVTFSAGAGGVAFDNNGTVNVQAGILNLALVDQYVGDTLTGGTWIVGGTGSLDFSASSGVDIVTNEGDVTLSGPSSSFDRINALTTNNGALRLIGRDFTAVASLTGSGTLQLEASTITATSLSIDSGGSLIGNGTVSSTTSVSGTVAPGPGADELIFDGDVSFDGGLLAIEIASTSVFDLITVQGEADFTATNIEFSFLDSFLPEFGDSFDILTADSILGFSELGFSVIGLPSDQFELSLVDLGSIEALRLTAVIPLPGAVWLFGSGLLGLLAARRRKLSPTA